MAAIVWFRQDLRVSDNEALTNAASEGPIVPIYILDTNVPKTFQIGEASQLWLHHSLNQLQKSLNGKLLVFKGDAKEIIEDLIQTYDIGKVVCNNAYEPWALKQSEAIAKICQNQDALFESYNSNYLWKPDEILKNDGTFYKVFTPYKKKSYQVNPRKVIAKPSSIQYFEGVDAKLSVDDLGLISPHSWSGKIEKQWAFGEKAAQKKLDEFLKKRLNGYKELRDFPSKNHTSSLSPHLHFGEISPAQIWQAIFNQGHLYASEKDIEHFISELIWREFSCYLMVHAGNIHSKNFNPKFDKFPWDNKSKNLQLWQKGLTGIPIVDAGMRELWQTGTMHNRVRMIVASFLVKNLNIHWHKGRDWFWNCLVDADLANNSASWQWVAGCGADAAPYFRIFNPVTQGEKFDKTGEYTRHFVPELSNLPDKYLFKPWEAPTHILQASKVILGKDYPKPIVDLKLSREQALATYKTL